MPAPHIPKKNSKSNLAFKADFFPITVVRLAEADIESIKHQISLTVSMAPTYFEQAPVVIDLNYITDPLHSFDLEAVCQLLRSHNMVPVGLRGLAGSEQHIAMPPGLAIMKQAHSETTEKTQQTTLTETNTPASDTTAGAKTKLVTTPVRAGTQIYAKNGDLLITAAVNAGAECIADGNIYIYGPLRGIAVAGASGDQTARIFCESLEAHLVSIAGCYLTQENIQPPETKKPIIQIRLKAGKLCIDTI